MSKTDINWGWIRCFIRLHSKEVYKEETITDDMGEKIGLAIITRCSVCGKLHTKKVNFKSFI